MKKHIHFFSLIFTFFILWSCGPETKQLPDTKADNSNERFDKYKEHFVEELWKVYPEWASSQGFHKYDSALVIPDEASRYRELYFSKAHRDSLKAFDPAKLNANNRTDYYLIDNQLRYADWAIRAMRAFEWDPSDHNVAGGISELLAANFDKLDNRLLSISKKMYNVPPFYEAAKGSLKNPTREHTELAIQQTLGSVSLFEKELPDSIKASGLPEGTCSLMLDQCRLSAEAMKGYADHLKKMQNLTPRSFRLGKDLYEHKFTHELQSVYTGAQVYQRAVKRKEELHAEMAKISRELFPKYFGRQPVPASELDMIGMVINKISEKHAHRDSFQAAIEKQLPELVDFINKKDLIYIDPSKPLVVRREPAYMAGVAGVSISAPGPYDKNGNTYYNVGSLNGWTKERAESYLREYNHYILQILNIHEAIPGHYTQLVYSNQSPSIIKSLLGNNAMIEGWAVYGERMMLENGYGNNEPEMWLMYYKWHLRSVCNTILDYSVHCLNMPKEEALDLLVNEAFQQQAEAEGKWRRVTVTQVQLCCYFTGYTEIYDLREEMKKKEGDKFSLKAFHEKFLSYGSAPVKYIREAMISPEL